MSHTTTDTTNKRILLLVSGMSPQILTETLYALAVAPARPDERFIPDEIHLISTSDGARQARLLLLEPGKGYFYRLCDEYGLNPRMFNQQNIHVISNQAGEPLADIRTPADNDAAADIITGKVRHFTRNNSTTLHVSLAGGRKTMGYYAGYALSLFGRSQDRLSHVLVSEGYENNREFFYPTRQTQVIVDHNGKTLDATEARVTLAEIPFIRMRDDIPARLLKGHAGFSETIKLARLAEQPAIVSLSDDKPGILVMNEQDVTLQPSHYSFYYWMLLKARQNHPPVPAPNEYEAEENYGRELCELIETLYGDSRDFDRTLEALNKGMEKKFFDEKISRINTTLTEQLGKRLASQFKIERSGKKGFSRYGISLEPEQIILPQS